ETVSRCAQDIENQGTTQPFSSPWASSVVIVTRTDGSSRFCVKKNLVRNSLPLPSMEGCFDTLEGAKYLSGLDVQSVCWKLLITNACEHQKTTLVVPYGKREFKHLMFGVANPPLIHQRFMLETFLNVEI
ncbi:unnamed protein product, partial [Choristocarpus tenellus]